MPSLQSRFVLFMLKHRHWLKGQRRKDVVDWSTSIPALREEIEKSAEKFARVPEDIIISAAAIEAPTAEWVMPAGADKDRALLYFHGGGYVSGSAPSHRGIVSKFVQGSGVPALVFDYRLAPENPFPAAVEDTLAAYRWLLSQGVAASHIVFMGDSAGAGLCLASLLAVKDQGLALPAAAVALSPWTDLKLTGPGYQRTDPLAPDGSFEVYAKYYAGDSDPGLPWISPLYGELAGLPPMLIIVGSDEVLLEDSTRFAARAKAAQVDVTLKVGEGMVHCYPALAPMFPEASEAMDQICAFIRSHLAL